MPAHDRPSCIAQTKLRVPTCVGTETSATRGRRAEPLAGSVRRGSQARWCLLHPTPPGLSWAHVGARHPIAAPWSLSTTALGARQVSLRAPADPASAFVPARGVDLEHILYMEEERVVGRDNVVTTERVALQLAKQPGRPFGAGSTYVRRHLSGQHSVWYGARCLGRYETGTAGPWPRECRYPERSDHGVVQLAGTSRINNAVIAWRYRAHANTASRRSPLH
jgi:hypothetical protein